MTTDTVPQSVLFPDLFDKPLVAKFNQEQASSDGGAVLLKATERVYGLVKAFARCLSDKRAPEKIRHTLADLLGQRIFGIACGHPDCNDAEHLADDPIHKLLLDRDPVAGESLASQPTLSRFENAPAAARSTRWGANWRRVLSSATAAGWGGCGASRIDLDPTDDPTHGAQQYSLFNGVLRQLVLLAAARVPDVRPRIRAVSVCGGVAARQGGRLPRGRGAVGAAAASAALRVSAGALSGSARRRLCVPGAVRLPGCAAAARLRGGDGEQRRVAAARRAGDAGWRGARERSEQTEHFYMETEYAARTWSAERRVIIKGEVVRLGDREPRDNPRFVVTNMRQTPRFLYEKVYCARGEVENRIKELKDLQLDRTSCCKLRANQLRVFLTAAAYVLMQELRLRAARTACARTQVLWLRDRLLKLSVHVVRSVRRLILHLPRSTPNLDAWRKIAFPSGRAPGSTPNASLDPRARPPTRRSCLWLARHDGHRASYCSSTTPSPVDGVEPDACAADSRADHTLPVVCQDPS